MAVADFFGGLKNKVRSVYNNFFYDGGEAPAPQGAQEYAPVQEQPYAPQQPQVQWQQPYAGAQPQQGYQQAAYQQPYQPQPAYQQPYQQSVYQQPAYQPQPEAQPQPRTRRMQHHGAQQQDNNVVDFGAYQQRQQPQAQPAPQAAPEPQGQQSASLLSARVINARGMADCRSAITLLRSGDAVMIVLENITDPTEMRRLVDTLSGACYSLTATITKVSRHGVYLLAPQTLAVYTDQATNAMNSAPARPQARNYQPGYTGQRVAYSNQPMQQPQPQENPYAGQQGFTQRAAMPDEEPRNFYQRPMPQSAQTPSFSAQPVSYGYAPDEAVAADQ